MTSTQNTFFQVSRPDLLEVATRLSNYLKIRLESVRCFEVNFSLMCVGEHDSLLVEFINRINSIKLSKIGMTIRGRLDGN